MLAPRIRVLSTSKKARIGRSLGVMGSSSGIALKSTVGCPTVDYVTSVRLTLIAKPDCHLCDDARDVVTSVIDELAASASITLEELSILDDPALNEKYWEEIPVLLINGAVHNMWRIDPVRLSAALTEAMT